MTYLSIRALERRFGSVTALAGVDLDVKERSRTAIVGPSGSGKTTLLRLIAGFDTPDGGSISLDGKTIVDGRQSVPAHKRGIGVIAQDGALFPHLDIGDNIGFGIDRSEPHRDDRIAALAETVGLKQSMLERRPDQLSGGQQQRVAIARALAREPRLMLLDEPFSALDTGLRSAMRKAVGDILDNAGVTTILVTHDQSEALSFADQVAVMDSGSLAQVGTPRELYFRPKNRMVAEFLGESIVLPAKFEDGMAICSFGRLSLFEPHRASTHVMIRPEQVTMSRGRPDAANACEAVVTGVEFAGSQCLVILELVTRIEAAASSQIVLHASGYDLPEQGESVRLSVKGHVHAMD
ncbi:MAG: transporter ATP-binding protein [Rhizobium sp.]|nr:transporter ATP-binding protein [Rhizobium sp.]